CKTHVRLFPSESLPKELYAHMWKEVFDLSLTLAYSSIFGLNLNLVDTFLDLSC
ncbi:hypothetical protein BgiMline_034033, partial [Biomphalaria glabrata]